MLRPVGSRLLVKKLEGEERIGNIVVAKDTSADALARCEVVDLARGVDEETGIGVGDVIFCYDAPLRPVTHKGETYFLVEPEHILCVIDE